MAREKRKATDSEPKSGSKSKPKSRSPLESSSVPKSTLVAPTTVQFLRPTDGSGPLLASFSGVTPASSSSFKVYSNSESKDSRVYATSQSEKMTFTGSSYQAQGLGNKNVQYFVGVYDKTNKSVLFKKAPLLTFEASVTALDDRESEYNQSIKDKMFEAKQDLGLTFGSKKKKTQIRADTRNRIDLNSISTTEGDIMSSIGSRTKNMPTLDALKEEADELRPIPVHDSTQTDVTKAYDINDVAPLFAVTIAGKLIPDDYGVDVVEIGKLLKIDSHFVSTGLSNLKKNLNDETKKYFAKNKAKLCYLSVLLRFRELRHADFRNFGKLTKQFEGLSRNFINHLVNSFTEISIMKNGKKGNVMTKFGKDKLSCYIAVFMLSLNNWEIEPTVFAKELGLSVATATDYLRSVGCKVESKFGGEGKSTEGEANSNEDDGSSSGRDQKTPATGAKTSTVKAYLVAPLVFPSTRRFVRK